MLPDDPFERQRFIDELQRLSDPEPLYGTWADLFASHCPVERFGTMGSLDDNQRERYKYLRSLGLSVGKSMVLLNADDEMIAKELASLG